MPWSTNHRRQRVFYCRASKLPKFPAYILLDLTRFTPLGNTGFFDRKSWSSQGTLHELPHVSECLRDGGRRVQFGVFTTQESCESLQLRKPHAYAIMVDTAYDSRLFIVGFPDSCTTVDVFLIYPTAIIYIRFCTFRRVKCQPQPIAKGEFQSSKPNKALFIRA